MPKRTLVLRGHYEGADVKLAGYRFVKGRCVLEGTEQDLEGITKYLSRCYQAFPEGADDHGQHGLSKSTGGGQATSVQGEAGSEGGGAAPSPDDPGAGAGGAEAGSAGSVSRGDGHSDAGVSEKSVPVEEQIRSAVAELDPNNDEHWTGNGLPAIQVLEKKIGSKVTREAVNNAAPGVIRKK